MKFLKMLLVLVVVLFSSSAWALDLTWDHANPANVTGYTLYYAPTDGSSGPYNISIQDGMVMTITIPENHFQPNVEYTIYATAYNLTGESAASDPVTYRRTGWGPPSDQPPIILWIKPGKPSGLR